MVLSQNGWAAGATKAAAAIVSPTLNGIAFPGGLKDGDPTTVLLHLAAQFHARVEPLTLGWCWGWNYRAVRGAGSLSNHASGTAIDLNAPRHPLAKSGTFNPGQQAAIRAILAELSGTVRWGGDYSGRKDEMHFELVGDARAVARVADRLRAHPPAPPLTPALTPAPAPAHPVQVAVVGGASHDGTLRQGAKGAEVVGWQAELWRLGFGVGAHDGLFGPSVEGATLDLQRAAHLAADGVVGNATRDAARVVPTYPKAAGPALPLCGPGGPAGTVHEFQRRLAERGWRVGVDGRYGPQTGDVVRRFQADATARGYVVGAVDGIGGPATWTALWLAPMTS